MSTVTKSNGLEDANTAADGPASKGRYEGQCKNHIPHGEGTKTYPDGIKYVGQFQQGKYHGCGVRSRPTGEKYDGQWQLGLYHGQGVKTFAPADKSGRVQYAGEWQDGKFHGKGKMSWMHGEKKQPDKVYEGEWKAGKFHGPGKLSYAGGDVYDGQWQEDYPYGLGTMTFAPSNKFCHVRYVGSWYDGKFHGKGVMTFTPTDKFGRAKYDGGWQSGKFSGDGTLIYSDGHVECGKWEEGKLQFNQKDDSPQTDGQKDDSLSSLQDGLQDEEDMDFKATEVDVQNSSNGQHLKPAKRGGKRNIKDIVKNSPRCQGRRRSRLEEPGVADQLRLENEELRKEIEKLRGDVEPQAATRSVYLPKEGGGVTVLEIETGDKWLATNKLLKASAPGLAFRYSKDREDRVQDPQGDDVYLPWGESLGPGVDEGDGWVRFEREIEVSTLLQEKQEEDRLRRESEDVNTAPSSQQSWASWFKSLNPCVCRES